MIMKKIFNKEYIKTIETEELDGKLYDFIGVNNNNHECEDDDDFDFTIVGEGKSGGQPIELTKLKEIINGLIEENCTHMEIKNHADHPTYLIDGIKICDVNNNNRTKTGRSENWIC